MTKIVGNDISGYQGDVDFPTYKNNSNFIIIKATEGTGFTDTKLTRNQSGFRSVGLPLGYYHFARPSRGNSAQAEADYFLSKIGALKDGEVLCLDYEDTYNGDVVTWCKGWLDRVFAVTGVKALIYMDQSRLKSYAWGPVVTSGYGLWLAVYTYDPNNNNFTTGAWPFAAMQQWTSSQKVPGIVGNVDGDVFFGDATTFKKYGYKEPVLPPQTDYKALYEAEVKENATLRTQIGEMHNQVLVLQDKIAKARVALA